MIIKYFMVKLLQNKQKNVRSNLLLSQEQLAMKLSVSIAEGSEVVVYAVCRNAMPFLFFLVRVEIISYDGEQLSWLGNACLTLLRISVGCSC